MTSKILFKLWWISLNTRQTLLDHWKISSILRLNETDSQVSVTVAHLNSDVVIKMLIVLFQ